METRRLDDPIGGRDTLSPREREIIHFAMEGHSDKAICTQLGIHATTARTHWQRIRSKLGATNRAQAIAIATRHELGRLHRGISEKQDLLQTALHAANLSLFTYNPETDVLHVVGFTDGVDPFEMTFQSFRDALEQVHPEDRAAVVEARDRCLAEIERTVVEFRFQNSEGKWEWVRAQMCRTVDDRLDWRISGSLADVHEEVERRNALAERARQAEATFRDSDIAQVEWSLRQNQVIRANRAFEALVGYSTEELRKLPPGALFHPEDAELDRENHAALANGSLRCFRSRKRYVRGDGATIWVDVFASSLPEADGTADRAMAVLEDITEEVRSQNDLRRMTDVVHLAMESAGIAWWEILEEGGPMLIGGWICRLLGKEGPVARCAPADWLHVADPEDLPLLYSIFGEAGHRREPFEFQIWLTGRDGRRYRTQSVGRRTRDARGASRVVGITLDVTRQYLQARSLRNDVRLEQLANAVPALVYSMDLEGRYIMWNSVVTDYTGLTDEDLAAGRLIDAVHPDDREAALGTCPKYIPGLDPARARCRIADREGAYRWFDVVTVPMHDEAGAVHEWIGSATDVDALARAEVEMRRTATRNQFIGDAFPGILWIAAPNGDCLYAGGKGLERMGLGPADMLGRAFLRHVHPVDDVISVAKWEHAVQTGTPYENEQRMRTSRGEFRWMLVRAEPILDEEGRPLEFVGVAYDIHEQKLAHERQEAVQVALNQQVHASDRERNAYRKELDDLCHLIAHDLRPPLRAILAESTMLIRDPALTSQERSEALSNIDAAAHRMGDLIAQLLDYARMGRASIRPKRVDVTQLVRLSFERAIRSSARPCRLWVEDGIFALGDGELLATAISALVDNAVKFGGLAEAIVEVSCDRADGELRIRIKDNGIGFDPRYADRIFGPFERLGADAREGNGMGLAVVRRVADLHGGHAYAESEPGEGSTFVLVLPLVAEPER